MRILGIDPGYATIGFGLIEGERAQYRMVTYGAITTPAGLPLSKRLYQIDRDMEELIGQLKPDVISIEELSMACPKLSQAHIEQLKSVGALSSLPDESQMSLF